MSTGLELVPLALAAGVAVAAVRRRSGTRRESILAVDTRLRDESLLVEALRRCGSYTGAIEAAQHGVIGGTEIALSPAADGTWSALFEGSVPAETAQSATLTLDAAYCAVLAERLTDELRDRAQALGLSVSEPRPGPDGGRVVSITAGSGEGAVLGIGDGASLTATTFGSTGEACLPWIATVEHCGAARTVSSTYTPDFFATGAIGGVPARHQAEEVQWQQG
jgi:hypothetical protein